MIWIDRVTVSSPILHSQASILTIHPQTSKIGRQHIVLGENASNRVTISNCEIDGSSTWSATCDGHHYWAVYLTGCK